MKKNANSDFFFKTVIFGRTLLCATALTVVAAHGAPIDDAKNELNQALKGNTTLRVATSLQWAPFAYAEEGGKATGIDIELVDLLAQKLGLKAEFSDIKFPSIVPGITTGRYDIGVNQIGITDERTKVVDFIPYFRAQYGLLVRKGAPKLDINNLCGHTLALTQGSSQILVVDELSKTCQEGSKPAIKKVFYPNSADTYMAVANGRGDGFIAAKAVAIYISQHNANLDVMPETLAGHFTIAGIAVSKQLTPLKKALHTALEESIKDGSYRKLLEKYGVPESAYSAE